MKRSPRPKLSPLLYFGFWAPTYVLYGLGMRHSGGAPTYAIAFIWAGTYFVPGMLVSLLAWRIAQALPCERFGRVKMAATEGALIVAYSTVWQLGFFVLLYFLAGPKAIHDTMPQVVGFGFLYNLLILGTQEAVFHTLRVFQELRAKEIAIIESDRLRVRAEMEALRGQLNPHFLFNSLHSITALVRDDPKRAEEALLQFGALLRRLLDLKRDAADEVTLAEEMRFVDDYLAIEQLRLGDRLVVERDLTDDALECWLPTFSVQALVENSILHAIEPHRQGGRLRIHAAVDGGRLKVSVEDNGPGADPAEVAQADGVGLSVIRQRLQVRHGSAATLEITTSRGAGFAARLDLPAVRESEFETSPATSPVLAR